MITYGFGAGFGLPEISPFVTKTEVQLKMAGLTYRKETGDAAGLAEGAIALYRRRGEHRRFPPSSAPISNANTGFDFDALLSQERAQAWAFERMIEHHVYWALVGARWVDPDNFARGPTHFFDGAPEHAAKSCARTRSFGSPRIIC